jgi:hypothetical protein
MEMPVKECSYPRFSAFLHEGYEMQDSHRTFAKIKGIFWLLTFLLQRFPNKENLTTVITLNLIHYNETIKDSNADYQP